MRLFVIFVFILVSSYACKSKESSSANDRHADEQYHRFQSLIKIDGFNPLAEASAKFVATYHYEQEKREEAQAWLIQFKYYQKPAPVPVPVIPRFDKKRMQALGGVKKIEVKQDGCSVLALYYLNKKIRDTNDLKFILSGLAQQLLEKLPACNSSPYVAVRLYRDLKNHKKRPDDFLASYTISEAGFVGKAFFGSLED